MKTTILTSIVLLASMALLSSCGNSKSSLANNGQLVGATYTTKQNPARPFGMVHIPQGTFHMGPSDEDMNYAFTARNRQVSINGY